jgi:hypothetical protein
MDGAAAGRLRIAGVLVVVAAESLELLFVAGVVWTLRDFEIGGTPPPQEVAASTSVALVLFGLLGLNVLAGLTVATVSGVRRRLFGARSLAVVQALDVCVGGTAMVFGTVVLVPSDVGAGALLVLLSGAGIALLVRIRGAS